MEEAVDSVEGLYKALTLDEKTKGFKALINQSMDDDAFPEWKDPTQIWMWAVIGHAMMRENGGSGIIDTVMAHVWEGPLDAGETPSKDDRNMMISIGLVNQIVVKGEQGFSAATYALQYIAEACGWVKEDKSAEDSVFAQERKDGVSLTEVEEAVDKELARVYDETPDYWREALIVYAYGLEKLREAIG